ncbi:MAG: signal peptidase I [Spirochaetales bacterium]|nr:signal peptidase I [Spirochaetales bacterium]
MTKKRYPLLAAIFSFFIPGLGQLYCGKIKRAVVIWNASFLLLMLFVNVLAGIHLLFKLAPVFVILIALACSVDAYIIAVKNKEYTIKKLNKIIIYSGYIVFTIFVFLFLMFLSQFNIFHYRSWAVPTGSMNPTIEGSETVVGDNWIYKFEKPKSGDIVLMWIPEHERYRVNRVVAVDEAEITFDVNGIYKNGKMVIEAGEDYDNVKQYFPDVVSKSGYFTLKVGEIFVVGDNYINSKDSRDYGPFPLEYVFAKIIYRINEEDPERDGTYF